MSIKSELKKGIMINFISKYFNVAINIVIWGILARLISPQEFGIIAIINVFTTFFRLVSNMGIGNALVQNKELSEEDYSIIFNFTVIMGIIFAIFFYNFSYLIAKFYLNKEYIKIGKYLSLSIFFYNLNTVPHSLLLKDKEFQKIGIIEVTTNLFVGIIIIYLAFNKLGYWVLIWKSLLNSILNFILTYTLSQFKKFKLTFKLKLESLKKISKFSLYQFLYKFIEYFSKNLDNLFIGKFMGVISLGYYDKSHKLTKYLFYNLTLAITPVLHPVFAKYQNDKEIIYSAYIKIIRVLSLIGIPLSVYFFFSAKEIISILFGYKWYPSIPIFKIMTLMIGFNIVTAGKSSIFQSSNRTDILFLNGLLQTILTASAILYGVYCKDLIILAYGLLLSTIFNFIFCFWTMANKIFKIKLSSFFLPLKNSVIISMIIFIFMVFLQKYIELDNIYIIFIIKSFLSFSGFLIGLFLTEEYKFLYNIFIKK